MLNINIIILTYLMTLPYFYDTVLNRLDLQYLADRRISIDKVFLLKPINGSID